MPTLVLDAVRGAELERTPDFARYVRAGFVKDIELVGTSDPDALVRVLPLLPAFGTSLGPQSPGLRMARVRIVPEEAKFRMVRLFLTYETDVQNLTPTVYVVRDRTHATQKRSCVIPGTNHVISASFTDPDTGELVEDFGWRNIFIPARGVSLTILRYGRPSGGAQDRVCYVNDAVWPVGRVQFGFSWTENTSFGTTDQDAATSKPRGYWLLNNYSTEFDRYRGMTLVQSEAITRNIEDWSEITYVRNQRTGRYPFAALSNKTDLMNQLLGPPYQWGPIAKVEGATRDGDYPTTDFQDIFGF